MTQPAYAIVALTPDAVFDAPVFAALRNEYEREALRNPDLAGSVPDRAGYQALFEAGVLHPLGIFAGAGPNRTLAGFCTVLLSPVLHHKGRRIAITETLFVAKAYRRGGAGMALIRAAERIARQQGAAPNLAQSRCCQNHRCR